MNLYQPDFYDNLDRNEIIRDIKSLGFEPKLFQDPPGKIYPSHHHPTTKILAFLSGSMKLTVGDNVYECSPGDKVIIESDVEHEGVVGPEGCSFFWAEKF